MILPTRHRARRHGEDAVRPLRGLGAAVDSGRPASERLLQP